jgi:cellulose synthase/poly-beta-1,6-N-acetylglucosamine synthase-like glycosyltransferase
MYRRSIVCMTVLLAILGTFAALILVPVTVLLVQVLMALPAYRTRPLPQGRRLPVGILIPAHDEAAVIAATLGSILPQLTEGDRLLVVADNCTDDTAAIAADEGATVIERHNAELRGKGHALEFGIRHLETNPPDIVIIVDADCQADAGTIDRLSRTCDYTARPVQSLYLMHAPAGAGLTARVAEFAWIVRNWIRPLGQSRLGLPCQLTGSGMAFPWRLIRNLGMANSHIVEDMKFGIDLALAGYPTVFCPDATVTSYFPSDKMATVTQRTRWEHGHLSMILHELPRLLACAFRMHNFRLVGLAADLVVLPLTLLTLIIATVFLLNLVFFLFEGFVWPLILSLIALGLLVAAIAVAWYGWGRKVISLASMTAIPFYILFKIPLYLRFLTKRQKSWVKTKRD